MRANWANPDKQICGHQGRYDGCLECAKPNYAKELEEVIMLLIKQDWNSDDLSYFCDIDISTAEYILELYRKICKKHKESNNEDI